MKNHRQVQIELIISLPEFDQILFQHTKGTNIGT
jgi:hypothetical protein